MAENEQKTCCVVRRLTTPQIQTLKAVLERKGWILDPAPFCFFKTRADKLSVSAYQNGKLVVQGRNAEDFLEFVLEPEVLKEQAFLHSSSAQEQQNIVSPSGSGSSAASMTAADPGSPPPPPPDFFPHAGTDESGKGDFFGPLVIACVFIAEKGIADSLEKAGVRDSKRIKSDKVITMLAARIRKETKGLWSIVAIGPEAYNRTYEQIGSLNRLLAWGHARALENLLEKAPECNHVLSDKFGDESLIRNALMKKGRTIRLEQKTRAESDIAVAAASILARAEFIRRLHLLGELCGRTLPRGAGLQVDEAAAELAASGGRELLNRFGKMHFRTAVKALGLPAPPKQEWHR